MAFPISQLLGLLAAGVTQEFFDKLIGDLMQGAGMVARWEAGKRLVADDWLREGYDSLMEGQAHGVVGYSPRGLIHGIIKILDCTTRMSMILKGEMVEELFMELIQEGMSNAIQTSFGGAYQSMLNAYRGGNPPFPDHAADIMQHAEAFDDGLRALLVAMSGVNIPTFAFQAVVGFERATEQKLQHLRRYLLAKVDEKDDAYFRPLQTLKTIALQYAEAQAEKEWMVKRRANDMIADAARRYLARVNELWDELESVKTWFDAGLIDETDATLIAMEHGIEADVIESYFDDLKTAIESKVSEIVAGLSYDYTPVAEIQQKLDDFAETVSKVYSDEKISLLTKQYEILQETLQRLRAYRYETEPAMIAEEHVKPTYPVIGKEVWAPIPEVAAYRHFELGLAVLATSPLG